MPILPNVNLLTPQGLQSNGLKLINGQVRSQSESDVENETDLKGNLISVGVQTDVFHGLNMRPDVWYRQMSSWLNQQENKGLKVILIILVGLVITMFWYLRHQVCKSYI